MLPFFRWFSSARNASQTNKRAARRRLLGGVERLETRSLLAGAAGWMPIGPASIAGDGFTGGNVAGRLTGIAADPTDAGTIYIATAGGGVWKTTNGGGSWNPLTDDQQTLAMGAISIAPSNRSVLYAGTGEANNSGDSQTGRGILVSSDAGATWTLTGASQFNNMVISKIAVDPTNADVAYAAAGPWFSGTPGIYKTTDRGATWNPSLTKSGFVEFSDVAIDPTNPQVLYAAAGTYFGNANNGVYKSTDGGGNWTLLSNFPSGTATGRITLAIAPSNTSTIYGSISNPSSYGLSKMMKSTDAGANWTQLNSTPNYMGGQGWYDQSLAVDPSNANIVFAGGSYSYGGSSPNGFIESTNGGASWTEIGTFGTTGIGTHPDHHAIAFDAHGKLLDGDDGGIFRLDNPTTSGWAWSDLNSNLNITQFTGIALHPTDPNIAYGGSQDNGTEKYTGNLEWDLVRGGDGGFVRVDQVNPDTVYHTFYYSGQGFLERSDNGGASWNGKTSGIITTDPDLPDEEDPARFYPPYIIDPANHTRLLLGTNRVYESTNQADSWSPISATNSNGWTTNAAISTIGGVGNTIYAAAGGHIYVTTNNGGSWTETTPTSTSAAYEDIWVDPANPQVAYAVNSNAGLGRVFKTINGGAAWTNLSGDIPALSGHGIRVDTASNTIYAGLDNGVYSSTNDGAAWTRTSTGLPNVQVVGLELNTTTHILAAATHGRGMWELSLAAANTAPVANDDSLGTDEDTPADGTVTATDDDNDPLTFTVVSDPSHGELTAFDANTGAYTYSPDADYSGSDSFTFTANDGTADSNEATISITVTAVNDAPVIANFASTLTYTENDPPLAILSGSTTVADVDSADFDGGRLTVVTTARGSIYDVVSIANQGTGTGQIGLSGSTVLYEGVGIGSFAGGTNGGPLGINFNSSSATPAAAQALLRAITFHNVSDNPYTLTRTIRFALTDGDGGTSNLVFQDVAVVTVNDAPNIANFANTDVYTENDPSLPILSGGTIVTDPDSTNFSGGKLTVVTTAHGSIYDVVSIANQGTGAGQIGLSGSTVSYGGVAIGVYGGGVNGAPLGIYFAGAAATPAAAQALMRAITFHNVSEVPYTLARTVRFTLTDGDGGTSLVFQDIAVVSVNDATVIGNYATTTTYFKTFPPVAILSDGTTLTDPDSANFSGGKLTVVTIANASSRDVVKIDNQGTGAGQIGLSGSTVLYGGIAIGVFGGGTNGAPLGIYFLGSAATPAAAQALIRAITFESVGENLYTRTRTIRFTLTDGDGGTSNLADQDVSVSNDTFG